MPKILKPNAIGLSAKSAYYDQMLINNHDIDFFEAHIENYIAGGHHLQTLKKISETTPITLHGVALSLGSMRAPTHEALLERKKIIDLINPTFISEHAACTYHQQHLNDLLPIALNTQTAQRLSDHIAQSQDFFGRQILLENLSAYMSFDDDKLPEAEFLNIVAQKSGCGLLLDINNIHIQEYNLNRSATAFLRTINPDYIQQYHLAGGEYNADYDIIIDTHGTDIHDDVMQLYRQTLNKIGPRPTLYERDNNIPPFHELVQTANLIRKTQMDTTC